MHDLELGAPVGKGEVVPNSDLVSAALEFAKGAPNVAVHCTAGVSRSSAMAFLVACQMTGDPEEAVKVLDMKSHFPNESIVLLGERLLDKDMEIMSTIIKFNRDAAEAMFDKDNE